MACEVRRQAQACAMALAPAACDVLFEEHRVLLAQYARVQKRCGQLLAEQAQEIDRLQRELMRLRIERFLQLTRSDWFLSAMQAVQATPRGRTAALATLGAFPGAYPEGWPCTGSGTRSTSYGLSRTWAPGAVTTEALPRRPPPCSVLERSRPPVSPL